MDIDKDVLAKLQQAMQPPGVILVAEDNAHQRDELTRLLTSRGFAVVPTDTGNGAIVEARRSQASVILMDIAFDNGEVDGIEAAQIIQSDQPLTSFIFVTAYSDDPDYRRRVQESGVRLGGWVSKPYGIDPLVELIVKEGRKLELLAKATEAEGRGIDPAAYVLAHADVFARVDSDSGLTRDMVDEVLKELQAEAMDESLLSALTEDPRETPMATVSAEIDKLYDQIRDVIATHADASSRREAVRPLRAELEALEAREADLIKDHFRAQLRFDADRAEAAEQRMRELLEQT